MSKKTQNIRQSFDCLESLQQRLALYNQDNPQRELQDIEFELKQQISLLEMWFESLYKFNGKSTSRAKQNASRANGKKGGRPPKEVTMKKKRRAEIEGQLIPDLKNTIAMTNDMDEEMAAKKQLKALQKELKEIYAGLGEQMDDAQ